ncbi:hypothetical protein [Helicobacter japonicus]|uniref:hypothetical protein n=1 Tax=Helicobacter japonicus TaxID=425400 RepID=UPI0023F32626|nr:hypothetical protein [Helicobacter japonicus]
MKYVLLSCILGMLVLSGCGEPKPRKLESCKNTPLPYELRGYKELNKFMALNLYNRSADTVFLMRNMASNAGVKPEDLEVDFSFKDIKTIEEKDGVFTCTANLEYELKRTRFNIKDSTKIEYTLHRVGNGIGFTITKPDIKAYNEKWK